MLGSFGPHSVSFSVGSPNRSPVLLALLGVNAAATAQTVTALPVQPNSYTYPAAINNSGLAIGNAYDRVTFRSQAVTWLNGAISSLPGFPDSFAGALNDTGVIVGSGFSVADNLYVPVVWENGTTAVLPTLGRGGLARDINSAGDIVGQVETETGGTVPAVWRNRQLTVLPGASGNDGHAPQTSEMGRDFFPLNFTAVLPPLERWEIAAYFVRTLTTVGRPWTRHLPCRVVHGCCESW